VWTGDSASWEAGPVSTPERRNEAAPKSVDTERGGDRSRAPSTGAAAGSGAGAEGTDSENKSPEAVDGGSGKEVEAAPPPDERREAVHR
jgi:hypothetical protein